MSPPGGGELDSLRAILPRVPDAPEPPPGSGTPKPTAPASPPLRVSDADREATAERLRQACAEGRIDAEELDERLGQTYRARIAPDLVRGGDPPHHLARRAERDERRREARRGRDRLPR